MKTPIKSFLLSLGLLTLFANAPKAAAQAGAISGGGGKAIVCRDHRNRIKSVELLDLWEARELYGLKIPRSKAPVTKQMDAAIELLKDVTYFPSVIAGSDGGPWRGPEALAEELRRIASRFTETGYGVIRLHGKTLSPVNDSMEEAFPNGCLPEQVIIFHGDEHGEPKILVNQDLVDRMDAQNQAALYVHEALYYNLRILDGEENSLRTRRAVGLAFSGHVFERISDMFPDDLVACVSREDESIGSALIFFESEAPGSHEKMVMYKPLIIGGVYLMDFRKSSASTGTGARTLDELLAKVLIPPITAQSSRWSSSDLGEYGALVDREIRGAFETLTFDGTDKVAFAVNRVTTPWQPSPSHNRSYLTCVRVKKRDAFPEARK